MSQQSVKTSTRMRRWWPLLVILAMMLSIFINIAAAAVPTFPDNLVVFPERDFLSTEGFADHVGEDALVQVDRPGVGIVGAAEVTLGPGGVPFEINHPGGFCWGNDVVGGTGHLSAVANPPLPNVTPDIVPGDMVKVTFADGSTSDVTTQDAFVTGVSAVSDVPESGQNQAFRWRFTVTGHIGASVIQANTEQRIVNSELTDTPIGRRDIRAVPGGFAPDGNNQYLSNLEFNVGNTFTATYIFLDPAVANIAATGGGERLLSWQMTDAQANRQGITIAEFGEVGGPGFGGCPNGPLQSGPPGPTDVLAALQANGDIVVTWTPADPAPGTALITGYRVHAVSQTGTAISTWSEQIEIGRRITGEDATGTTITGLIAPPNETYDIYVVSVNNLGLETNPAIHAIPVTDITPPVVTASPPAGTYAVEQMVTLSTEPTEPGQIWYTLDGSDVLDVAGDPIVPPAELFTAPILISVDTTLRFAAFDVSGNLSEGSFKYIITNTPVPAAPTLAATVGQGSISLTWTDVPADPSIIEYTVTVYDAATGGNVVDQLITVLPANSTTFTGLTAGTPYWVTIKAANDNGYGLESARLGPLTPQGAVVANAGDGKSVVRGSVVTLDGSASIGATTFSWVQIAPASPLVTLSGAVTAGPTFTFPTTLAGSLTFELTVTDGGTASDTATVTISALEPDPLAVTRAEYRNRNNQWRLDGTATIVGPGNDITILLNKGGTQETLGTGVAVDAAGVWTLRFNPAAAQRPVAGDTITIYSSSGGLLANQPITIRQ